MVGRNQQPLYASIETYLRDLISNGEGLTEPLPPEEKLARLFGVSRMTAREAYRRLEHAGLVRRRRGSGTYAVAPQVQEALDQLGRLAIRRQWAIQGHRMTVVVRRYEIVPAAPEIADEFGVEVGSPLTYLDRLRVADGVPAAWDERYSVPELWPRISEYEFESATLLQLLARIDVAATEGDFTIGAENCGRDLAEILCVKPKSALLVRHLRFRDADGRLLVLGVSKAPAERVSFRLHVSIDDLASGAPSLDATATPRAS